jgi:hypothetical protein
MDDILDRFADHLEAHLDCDRLLRLSEGRSTARPGEA